MRLTSDMWVSVFVRRCLSEGAPAVVVRRGNSEAGAIFIAIDRLDGAVDLYGPAPSGLLETGSERLWVRVFDGDAVSEEKVKTYLDRQAEFDPDLWIIAVEDKNGRQFLDDALAKD